MPYYASRRSGKDRRHAAMSEKTPRGRDLVFLFLRSSVDFHLPFHQELDPVPCHCVCNRPETPRTWRTTPNQFKPPRRIPGKIDFHLPFARALDVKVRRLVVIRPEPALQARDLETVNLGHRLSIRGDRTFF